MNCSEWEERVALYAGEDLPPAEAAAVESHLGECAACQVLLGGTRESLRVLREVHQEPVADAHYAAVRARVLSELGAGRRAWWRFGWLAAAAAAALLFVLLWPHAAKKPHVARIAPVEPPAVEAPAAPPQVATMTPPAAPRRRPHRRVTPAVVAGNEQPSAEPLVVKLLTEDPDVIIYWITDTKGE